VDDTRITAKAAPRRCRLDTSSARPSSLVDAAGPRVEVSWWALAVASTVPVVAAIPDFERVDPPKMLALLFPALARTARMAWLGRTYSVAYFAANLVLAFVVSYFLAFMTLGMAIGIVVTGLLFGPAWVAALPQWAWFPLFVAIHLLFWPLRRKARVAAHPPGDPEN
jgi:hypothetical protein